MEFCRAKLYYNIKDINSNGTISRFTSVFFQQSNNSPQIKSNNTLKFYELLNDKFLKCKRKVCVCVFIVRLLVLTQVQTSWMLFCYSCSPFD